ncbi:exosporium protein C [Paenibacillus sp. VCA1]|uniref:exosporium protein C n=1 Tax=Paenibacillus sp. VCA1 TaxID=3039148 RepID=UPI002871EA76|nr:exosporium protein C [Paenibacillus sp. VCA1]MDR9856063.1 exosporium protein C [Paenibacillus sp. VCA1]
MAQQLIAYNASVPTPVTDGAAIPIPITPAGVGIASFRLTVPGVPNFVDLKGLVGIRGDAGTGSVLLRIFRDNNVIYYSRQGFEANFEKYYSIPVQFTDANVTPGVHDYTLSIENLTPGTSATVIGPIVFSGFITT